MNLGHFITAYGFNEKWNNTIIIIKDEEEKKEFILEYKDEEEKKEFILEYNAFLLKDDFGFLSDGAFINDIYKYKILNIEFLEDETKIKIKKIEKIGE